jgi:lysyl-tRNA synthetase, class II
MTERLDDYERQRLEKVDRLRAAGVDPYPIRFERTHTATELHQRHDDIDAGAETGERASVAGRVVLLRTHGKLSFAMLRDGDAEIQLFCDEARLGADVYARVTDLDLGDWVGADGEVIKTRKGELSVRCDRVELLAKALRPLPEKWHGLRDVELRYRQRYLDLAVNARAREIVSLRARTVDSVRAFLTARGFIEVETPMLQPTPGGALARPFVTHHNTLDVDLYLRVAPELYLKRLLIGGFGRVFEINRNFRNEGVSAEHNPEFTMLEAYEAYADYIGMMELLEEMVPTVALEVIGSTDLVYQGKPMRLAGPFPRHRLIDLASEAVGRELDLDADPVELRKVADAAGVDCAPAWTAGKVVLEIYEKLVEPKLFEPTFVLDFPRDVSPLARSHRDDPRFTEHFDLVIAGMEIGPAYSELNDPIEQRQRFEQQARARSAGDEEAMVADEDFLRAMEHGMPPAGGLGFGIDRFVMILADAPSIREVILFPLLRPEQ